LAKIGKRKKVLVVPPDFTRFHSRAGDLTTLIYNYYKDGLKDILPALGTHSPMSDQELELMYKGVPKSLFRIHDWRKDVVTIDTVPGNSFQILPMVPLIIPGLHNLTNWFSMVDMTSFCL